MRRRAWPGVVWTALLVGVVAALALTTGVAPDASASATVASQDDGPTWSGTYTPESESGILHDGVTTADGGYLLVGEFGPGDGRDRNALAVKVTGAGAVEWVWSLQGYGNATLAGAVQLADGRVLVAGTRRTQGEGPRRLVVALTPDGRVAWRDTYGAGRVSDVVGVPNGGALVVGGDTVRVVSAGGGDGWVREYADADLEAAARIGDGYVLAGAATADGSATVDPPDRLLVRIDGTGEPAWRSRRRGAGPDRYVDVVVDGDAAYAGGSAPIGDGATGHPSVSAFHPNGTHDWTQTRRSERPAESVTGLAAAEKGVVAASRSTTTGRLEVVASDVAGASVDVGADVRSITVLDGDRYLVTGARDGGAFAAVVRPDFEAGGTLLSGGEGDVGSDSGGSRDGAGGADTDAGGDDPGDGVGSPDGGESGGVGVPAFPVGGVPPVVTLVLVVAAAVATLVAIAVTVLSLRQLRDDQP